VEEIFVKDSFAVVTLGAVLAASLVACGGSSDKSTLPIYTGGSSPSATATGQPTKTAPTASKATSDPLATHSTHQYGDLKVVVNLPADIPTGARPSMRVFADFLRAVDRTNAENKLDPAVRGLAASHVVKYVGTIVAPGSVQQVGSITYTVDTVRTAGTSGYALVAGCIDQSKLIQVLKDGSRVADASAKKDPTLKMTAEINPSAKEGQVTAFTLAVGSC